MNTTVAKARGERRQAAMGINLSPADRFRKAVPDRGGAFFQGYLPGGAIATSFPAVPGAGGKVQAVKDLGNPEDGGLMKHKNRYRTLQKSPDAAAQIFMREVMGR